MPKKFICIGGPLDRTFKTWSDVKKYPCYYAFNSAGSAPLSHVFIWLTTLRITDSIPFGENDLLKKKKIISKPKPHMGKSSETYSAHSGGGSSLYQHHDPTEDDNDD
jgi:hypothetical protein